MFILSTAVLLQRLLTSGVVFESLPLTIVLPADAANVGVTLSGTSREVGQLEITGRLTALTRLSCTRSFGTPVHTEGYPKKTIQFLHGNYSFVGQRECPFGCTVIKNACKYRETAIVNHRSDASIVSQHLQAFRNLVNPKFCLSEMALVPSKRDKRGFNVYLNAVQFV